jgi:hypothetical protein
VWLIRGVLNGQKSGGRFPRPQDKHGRTFAEIIAYRVAMAAARGNLLVVGELADLLKGKILLWSVSTGPNSGATGGWRM